MRKNNKIVESFFVSSVLRNANAKSLAILTTTIIKNDNMQDDQFLVFYMKTKHIIDNNNKKKVDWVRGINS